ncbi:transporter substrate-binding domain-containing protein [Helicobacter saguini]|uniref:Transporter substrate-binding domain-containing protein n=1 Tax=Helicobacter saguini TaxID=1548018 RepID=A0A347VHA4_9HELI|nr:transporter substrate-binding domain-containing protein [Helicobacter saguini]MWV62214.1 transporter substrate-binding domain-containing protein [Helicobacter saguini]MWV67113.1 transporter substrate-binding domain-containing protein [Helicobacter saguini]MWV70984.1 transporter substrate-binding domain-containing protein [Helicobacter saguini]TLD92932.1 transporter substrate-binding domain-containing protein [Helicobacter saguini]
MFATLKFSKYRILLVFYYLVINFIMLNISQAQDFTNIKVGSENAYKPFAYVDDKGEAKGFDNDVVRIVVSFIESGIKDSKSSKNPNITFIPVSWNVIFVGLDSKKYDVVANQISKTKEREEKYIFSKKPYFYGISGLIVGVDSKIKSLDEFKSGDKIGVTIGSNHALNLENYAKTHNAPFKIVHYKTSPTLIADLANGRIKGMINDPIAALDYAKSQGVKIQTTDFILEKTPIFFIFRKDSKDLADAFDTALQKALDSGKIEALIREYFTQTYVDLIKTDLAKSE